MSALKTIRERLSASVAASAGPRSSGLSSPSADTIRSLQIRVGRPAEDVSFDNWAAEAALRVGRPDPRLDQLENQVMRELADHRGSRSQGLAQLRDVILWDTLLGDPWRAGPPRPHPVSVIRDVSTELSLPAPVASRDEPQSEIQVRLSQMLRGALDAELSQPAPMWHRFHSAAGAIPTELLIWHVTRELSLISDHRELIRGWKREPVVGMREALREAPQQILTEELVREAAARAGSFSLNLWRLALREIGAWADYGLYSDGPPALRLAPTPVRKREIIASSYDQGAAQRWEETPWWRRSERRRWERAARIAGVDLARFSRSAFEPYSTELHRRELGRRGLLRTIRYSPRGSERHQRPAFSV